MGEINEEDVEVVSFDVRSDSKGNAEREEKSDDPSINDKTKTLLLPLPLKYFTQLTSVSTSHCYLTCDVRKSSALSYEKLPR